MTVAAKSPTFSPLEVADRIGAQLARDALWDADRCNWLGASFEELYGKHLNVIRSLGPDLYSGTSGIALFLVRLAAQTGEGVYLHVARGALLQALSRVDKIQPELSIGLYSGMAGIGFACIAGGEALEDESLITKGLRLVHVAASTDIRGRRAYDVTSGLAGLIPLLICLKYRCDDSNLLEIASDLGLLLLRHANRTDRGWSWPLLFEKQNPEQPDLAGFSHGAAGIGWALAELFAETDDIRFKEAATYAFNYEQSWFDATHQNWADLRTSTSERASQMSFVSAWCHGAPGIALSRIRAFQLLGDSSCKRQAEVALRTTLASIEPGSSGSFCLCHGLAGNAEAFLIASDAFGDQELEAVAQRVGFWGAERYSKQGVPWPCGVPFGETPNLMLGLAGIGYFYLRLHNRLSTPSLLLWSPSEHGQTTSVIACSK